MGNIIHFLITYLAKHPSILNTINFSKMDVMMCVQLLSLIFVLTTYSCAEYIIHKIHHPDTTEVNSFLITKDYLIAYTCGVVEYLIERYFWPSKSDPHSIMIYIGYALIAVGLYIRFAAIITAGKSFTHLVQLRKTKDHVLITHGIYKYIRHPGYLGFLIFAVGTQIMLKNFFSVIGFYIVLWNFFNRRIAYEERGLIDMFGQEYRDYRDRTPTWIPFIK
ncbi:hypothetical protein TRFO_11930 [Tritrichomonas foetus]|uniref:Protein-S-isoprenylcysteine O-methyltransferase n=1 Tax=Tritrichomonas foetus TaxID=1144522 RepID=A0A1J4J580_9EUKA|nr:hypothetical protein TRFO_11930 [Tritrichomonas foetus]|eukprot:OHS93303.1 hypothetical protein TRFO_11930 [Tritrichomonas foetus]